MKGSSAAECWSGAIVSVSSSGLYSPFRDLNSSICSASLSVSVEGMRSLNGGRSWLLCPSTLWRDLVLSCADEDDMLASWLAVLAAPGKACKRLPDVDVVLVWKSCATGRVPIALGWELDRPRSTGALFESVLLARSGAVDMRMDGRLKSSEYHTV